MLSREQAEALVEQHGSQAAAARALGVHRQTFRYWLDPEAHQRVQQRLYHANPEKQRARSRDRWWGLSGSEYNRRLLQVRRIKGLHRMAERNQRRAEEAT